MATNDKKLSNLVSRQLPEFVQSQSPALLEFVEKYYTLLESAQLTITNQGDVDNILLETEVTSFLQLNATDTFGNDNGDYLVDEQSGIGEFQKDEIVTGQTSGQTATILAEDADNGKLYISSNSKFITGEEIVGATSNATAIISKYRANPVENITNLLKYIDIDDSIDDFFIRFRNKFLDTIPNDLDPNLDKEAFTKRVIDVYNSKGSKKAHEVFFRALFNETPEIYYPNRDMLRVSDGNWSVDSILKVTLISPSNGDTGNLVGQTITQQTVVGNTVIQEATAVVDLVTKQTVNGQEVSTLFINKGSITGTFISSTGDNFDLEDNSGNLLLETGDEIDQEAQVLLTGVDNTDPDIIITCAIDKVVDNVTVTQSGNYYSTNEVITVDNSTSVGSNASITIRDVQGSTIDSIKVETGGSGYVIGDDVVVTNTGTNGNNLDAEVRVVNGSFALETSDDNERVINEDGDIIIMEDQTNSGLGDITDIKITNKGQGYTTVPTLTVSSSSGSSASLFATSANAGRMLDVNILDHGFRYETAPILTPKLHMQIENLSSAFVAGETITMNAVFDLNLEQFDTRDDRVVLEPNRPSEIILETDQGGVELEDESGLFIMQDSEKSIQKKSILNNSPIEFLKSENDEYLIAETLVQDSTPFDIIAENNDTLITETLSTATAVVESYDGDRNILTLTSVNGTFLVGQTITGNTSGETATVLLANQASLTSTVGTTVTSSGEFINVDGHVSELTKNIQDSFYYQDYSYVVKVGEAITSWRDDLKRSIHPAGFNVFGEVSVQTSVSGAIKKGFTLLNGFGEGDFVSLLEVIFAEKIGRRLGTTTDGTVVRANPTRGIEQDTAFTANTRDVTLTSTKKVSFPSLPSETIRTVEVRTGIATMGPRIGTLQNLFYKTQTFSHPLYDQSGDNTDTGITIGSLNKIILTGTRNTSLNGQAVQLGEFVNNPRMKTNFAIPAEVTRSS